MMKLLIAGLALIAAGLGLVVFTDHNPATLFIGGVVCSFIAVVHGATPSFGRGQAVSADSASDGLSLSDLHNSGSADASAGGDI
jgi:hypothetical protein